jgi:hypothetical protein
VLDALRLAVCAVGRTSKQVECARNSQGSCRQIHKTSALTHTLPHVDPPLQQALGGAAGGAHVSLVEHVLQHQMAGDEGGQAQQCVDRSADDEHVKIVHSAVPMHQCCAQVHMHTVQRLNGTHTLLTLHGQVTWSGD